MSELDNSYISLVNTVINKTTSYSGLTNSQVENGNVGASGITQTSTDTFTNKTMTDSSNNIAAKSLHSATTVVDVSAATAPTSGQILQATSATTATWQTPAGGGSEFTATTLKTAAYTAVSGDWVLCDANAAAGDIDITLPATPSIGDAVKITLITEHATRKITINRNSSTIDGGTTAEFQDYNILWKDGDTVTFRCVATSAWITATRQIQNRFMMSAYASADIVFSRNVTTIVPINTELYDYNSNFNTGTYQWTAPITGLYQVSGGFTYQGGPAGTQQNLMYITGSAGQIGGSNYSGSSGAVSQHSMGLDYITAGQTLYVAVNSNYTTTRRVYGGTKTNLRITLVSR